MATHHEGKTDGKTDHYSNWDQCVSDWQSVGFCFGSNAVGFHLFTNFSDLTRIEMSQ